MVIMTPDKLQKLSEKKLFDYFVNHAGFQPDSPPAHAYTIRLGSRSLFAKDTADLWTDFKKKVKAYKKPLAPHIVEYKNYKQVCSRCNVAITDKNRNEQCPARI